MIVKGQNGSTGEKTRPSATLSTTNHALTSQELKSSLRYATPTTNRLRHGADLTPLCRRYEIDMTFTPSVMKIRHLAQQLELEERTPAHRDGTT